MSAMRTSESESRMWARLNGDLARLRTSQRGCEPDLCVSVGVVDESWLSKQEMAEHLGFSTRWVELRIQEGMPCERFGARLRLQRAPVEEWLRTGVA
jgi:excisionase family DNA binding protein